MSRRIGLVLGIWAVCQIFTGLLTPDVDNRAHLGELMGGAAASLVMC